MSKEKVVNLNLDAKTALDIRQILFDSQVGYTHDEVSVPSRISNIRKVIKNIDSDLGSVFGV